MGDRLADVNTKVAIRYERTFVQASRKEFDRQRDEVIRNIKRNYKEPEKGLTKAGLDDYTFDKAVALKN